MVSGRAALAITMGLSAAIVAVACLLFHRYASVQPRTTILLGIFVCYITWFAALLCLQRAEPKSIARLFMFGGLLLLVLGFIVWAEFSQYQSSPDLTDLQKRALLYYQQFAALFSSSLGGSAVFHGIRRFSEIANPPKNV